MMVPIKFSNYQTHRISESDAFIPNKPLHIRHWRLKKKRKEKQHIFPNPFICTSLSLYY